MSELCRACRSVLRGIGLVTLLSGKQLIAEIKHYPTQQTTTISSCATGYNGQTRQREAETVAVVRAGAGAGTVTLVTIQETVNVLHLACYLVGTLPLLLLLLLERPARRDTARHGAALAK